MSDGRIGVVLGGVAGPGDAVLREVEWAGHAAGCACCGGESAAGAALNRLFQRRARGEVAWFERVVVAASPAGERAVAAALGGDRVASARFRLERTSTQSS